MPKVAKPLSLTVRPFQVSHLCFEVGGILGRSLAELGTKVSAFDFDHLYKAFRNASTSLAHPGRLDFDSDGIDGQTITTPDGRRFALAALRAEPTKAALNKAIIARENAFITKYGKVTEIASFLKAAASGKNFRLARLSSRSQQRTDKLLSAYSEPGKGRNENEVVRTTTTDITAKRHEEPFVTTTTVVNEKTTRSRTAHEFVVSAEVVKNNKEAGVVEFQKIENTGYEFRMPFIEEDMRNDREQIMIADQRVSQFLESHYLDRLEEVYKNELASIDADVNQLQVAYLNTILLSPIDGIVTGVYKNPGDTVSPGEPVFRVENNANVLIVANVACRGPILVGSMLQVKTTLFDLPESPVTIEAEIVSVRGAGEDDQWEVIAKRQNTDNAGKGPLFPLGYTFDYDNTEVAIFGANEI